MKVILRLLQNCSMHYFTWRATNSYLPLELSVRFNYIKLICFPRRSYTFRFLNDVFVILRSINVNLNVWSSQGLYSLRESSNYQNRSNVRASLKDGVKQSFYQSNSEFLRHKGVGFSCETIFRHFIRRLSKQQKFWQVIS